MPNIVIQDKKNSIIKRYENKEDVANLIYNSFSKLIDPENGCPLDLDLNDIVEGKYSTSDNKYGLISNCMGLSTLLEIYGFQYDALKAKGKNTKSGKKVLIFEKKENQKTFNLLLEKVFNSIYRNEKIVFDMTPYADIENLDTYVESLSKVFITMIDLRDFLLLISNYKVDFKVDFALNNKKIDSINELLFITEKLIIDAMSIMNAACIPLKEEEKFIFEINGKAIKKDDADVFVSFKGWNFKKPDSGEEYEFSSSIYYTYHVSNAFLGLYTSFVLMYKDDVDPSILSEFDKYKYDKDLEFFTKNRAIIDEFKKKNNDSGRYYSTLLERNGVSLINDYINSKLQPVSMSSIINNLNGNNVINTLFLVMILINDDVDIDYKNIDRFSEFYENIQFCLNNVKKVHAILKNKKQDDIISTYKLIFDEKIPEKYNNTIQKMRKSMSNIKVYDFVPLYCNTYSNVSKFIIKFLQKEMQENITMIMDNCINEDIWLWDMDGFNVNNNLYYIFAIENFYDYYNEYEINFIKASEEKTLRDEKAKLVLEIESLKEKHNKEIEDLNNSLVKKYEEEKNKNDLFAQIGNSLEDLIKKNIDQIIEDKITNYINDMINERRKLEIEAILENKKAKYTSEKDKEFFDNHKKAKLLQEIYALFDTIKDLNFKSYDNLNEVGVKGELNKSEKDKIRSFVLMNSSK